MILHYSDMQLPATTIPTFDLYGERSLLPDVLHCETIAARSARHAWHIRPHRHERLHQFLALTGGTATLQVDGRTVALDAAAVVNLPARTVHGFRFRADAEGVVVTMPVELVERPLARCPVLATPAVVIADARLTALFAEVALEHAGAGVARSTNLAALATLIAGRIADRLTQREAPSVAPLVRRFEGLVEERFGAHWTVARYAAALGVSSTHLSRVCRAATGTGASRIIEARTMKEARRLLAYTATTVMRVADELGYADPAYFTRAFTRSCGMTPTAFRAALR